MCLQRYRIVMGRAQAPTGDTFFTYDYHYIGMIDEADAPAFQALAHRYAKVKFASEQSAGEPTSRPTTGPVQQETIDDEIPF